MSVHPTINITNVVILANMVTGIKIYINMWSMLRILFRLHILLMPVYFLSLSLSLSLSLAFRGITGLLPGI